MSDDRIFLYSASGMAIGGRITRPYTDVLPSQAVAVLPVTGGRGDAQSADFAYRDLVRVRRARTTVSGSEDDRHWHTVVTVDIEGLDVLGVVTADRVVASLASARPKAEPTDAEAPFRPAGSWFENLRVAGTRVKTSMDPAYASPAHRGPAVSPPVDESPRQAAAPTAGALFACELESPLAGVTIEGDSRAIAGPRRRMATGVALGVPGFGTVHLGEFRLTRNSGRLTMLQVELGSPLAGQIVIAGVQGNGSPYP